MSWAMFEEFENGNYILEESFKLVQNFICGNLNGWSPNKSYYYTQWNYLTKLHEVCAWRKKHRFRPIDKKREAICGGELVNFLLMKNMKIVRVHLFFKKQLY